MDDKDRHNHACGRRVVFAGDDHYADCDCPGPLQDDLYDYTEVDGVLYAWPINEEEDA